MRLITIGLACGIVAGALAIVDGSFVRTHPRISDGARWTAGKLPSELRPIGAPAQARY